MVDRILKSTNSCRKIVVDNNESRENLVLYVTILSACPDTKLLRLNIYKSFVSNGLILIWLSFSYSIELN